MSNKERLEGKDLSELKAIADELALEYPKNIGKAKLIDKILADEEDTVAVEGAKVEKKKSVAEIKKDMDKLIRCKVFATDPQYNGRNGVTLQVGNKHKVVGKFIPFNTIWHMQEPVYESLKRRQWVETKFITDPATGSKIPKRTVHQSFNIEVLPPLTKKELEDLAKAQAARGSIDND